MPINADLVDEVSPHVRVLRDTVEYHWLVGCTPTAVGIVAGYWDRHGYSNLIEGDSGIYNDNVRSAIASEGHYRDFYNPAGYEGPIIRDNSETGSTHSDDSIADFLHSSRSNIGLNDGWTWFGFEGVGFHGYASHRGYDNFETTFKSFSQVQFTEISSEIDAGRPVILGVDATSNGVADHNVVVFGYDSSSRKLLIQDGWETTPEMRWIDFSSVSVGNDFGIANATFVRPPSEPAPYGDIQITQLVNDGSGTMASYSGVLGDDGQLRSELDNANSGLQNNWTVALASADGHTFYQLYNDGAGSARLYKTLAYGDGTFNWLELSADSGLSHSTIEFATADGQTFYQLFNDGVGTAALYRSVLQTDGTFSYQLLHADCGLGFSTIGFSTTDGYTFQQAEYDYSGSAALYTCTLNPNGTFARTLVDADSGISNGLAGMVAWKTEQPPEEPVTPDLAGVHYDIQNTTQYLSSTDDGDIFVIAGNSADYGWGASEDGSGIVVWGPTGHDILYDFASIRFNDRTVALNVGSSGEFEDIANVTQFLNGPGEADTFVINGNSADYGWGATEDGQGTVVWNTATGSHDILFAFEKIAFNDRTVDLDGGGNPAEGLVVADDPNQTQYEYGTDQTDRFVIDGSSADYGWGATEDGRGIVVWNAADGSHDLLYDFEEIAFNNETVTLDQLA